jgi:hypothetical protein
MHPFLSRLKVRPEVQSFFAPYFSVDKTGNLVFAYPDGVEHFGFAFHKVPVSDHFWLAGERVISRIRQVFVCASAMDAIAWLHWNYYAFGDLDNLLFLSCGTTVNAAQTGWLQEFLARKKITLLFSGDLLGRICDLKVAAGLQRLPLSVYLAEEEKLTVVFRNQSFIFDARTFSLNAFEKAANYRFSVATSKPKGFDTFCGQLMAQASLTF